MLQARKCLECFDSCRFFIAEKIRDICIINAEASN